MRSQSIALVGHYNLMLRATIAVCLLLTALAIDQTCSPTLPCPAQSSCASNGYCLCNPGFIGTCTTPAIALTSSQITTSLTAAQTSLFSVNPEQLSHYIEFTFTVCQNTPQLSLTFTLWGEDGSISQYNNGDALAQPSQITLGSGCTQLVTPYIAFAAQPNGQNELLILGITDNGVSTAIQISVAQKIVIGLFLYEYILIALVAVVGVAIVVAATIVLYRRRARRRGATSQAAAVPPQVYNNIDYFELFMPVVRGDKLVGERGTCPICLQQIEAVEVVRKTPCTHVFHSSCLDSWCLKNLNCPVCRSDLSYDKLNEPRQSRNSQIIANQVYMSDWEEQESGGASDRFQIRESML